MNDSRLREALLEIKGYAERNEALYPRTIKELWADEKLEEALAEPARDPEETSVETGLIVGNPVAELQEKVKFLRGELIAIETKSGIESVFEQEKAQGRVEATSDLREKLEALRNEMGGMVMDARSSVDVHKTIVAPYSFVKKLDDIHKRLTAILDGKG